MQAGPDPLARRKGRKGEREAEAACKARWREG